MAKRNKPKRRDIHRQILERARISQECIEKATAKAPAESKLAGRASAKLLESIINRRSYDAYCCQVPRNDNETEDNSRGVFQQINDIRPAHRPLHEIRAQAEAKVDAIRRKGEDPELHDRSPSIEFEPTKYGPPGFRPPVRGILKSHGNERYFQGCK